MLERLAEAGYEDVKTKVAPARGRDGRFGKDDFAVDLEAKTVTCPAGQTAPIRTLKDGSGRADFAPHCSSCPLAERCTTATGKSHLLEALGHAVVDTRRSVAWCSIEDLGVLVRRHRVDNTVAKALVPMLRSDVIVVDDIGLLPVTEEAAEGLYRLVDAAYERRSIAISSNLHPSGFDELMPPSLATALVDRLLHHAHVVQTSGESIRLQDATSGKGVKPLAK